MPDSQPVQIQFGWSSEALLAKAQRYAEEMRRYNRDEWQFALWSTLTLELLGRSALAAISPVLLADERDWNNLYYSLGHTPKAAKFIPRSIDISTVFTRLQDVLPEFTKDLGSQAVVHLGRRNEELHSGATPFDTLRANWLPAYYEICKVLLASIGESLAVLFGAEAASVAESMIVASHDESAKAVSKSINAHQTVWSSKEPGEKELLSTRAELWATRQNGHRVNCPSCQCVALIDGTPISAPLRRINDDNTVTESQDFVPSKFECIACGLKITGLPQLTAANLGATYKRSSTVDLAEYYSPDDEWGDYEPDNNEP